MVFCSVWMMMWTPQRRVKVVFWDSDQSHLKVSVFCISVDFLFCFPLKAWISFLFFFERQGGGEDKGGANGHFNYKIFVSTQGNEPQKTSFEGSSETGLSFSFPFPFPPVVWNGDGGHNGFKCSESNKFPFLLFLSPSSPVRHTRSEGILLTEGEVMEERGKIKLSPTPRVQSHLLPNLPKIPLRSNPSVGGLTSKNGQTQHNHPCVSFQEWKETRGVSSRP